MDGLYSSEGPRAAGSFFLMIQFFIFEPIMKTVHTPIAEIAFNENENILNIKVHENAVMDLVNTQIHYEKINELVANKQYLALVDSSNYYSIEKDAWEYASLLKIVSNRKAVAHYNSCVANIITTSFFKAAYNTTMPVQIFDTKEEAIEWLKSFPCQ